MRSFVDTSQLSVLRDTEPSAIRVDHSLKEAAVCSQNLGTAPRTNSVVTQPLVNRRYKDGPHVSATTTTMNPTADEEAPTATGSDDGTDEIKIPDLQGTDTTPFDHSSKSVTSPKTKTQVCRQEPVDKPHDGEQVVESNKTTKVDAGDNQKGMDQASWTAQDTTPSKAVQSLKRPRVVVKHRPESRAPSKKEIKPSVQRHGLVQMPQGMQAAPMMPGMAAVQNGTHTLRMPYMQPFTTMASNPQMIHGMAPIRGLYPAGATMAHPQVQAAGMPRPIMGTGPSHAPSPYAMWYPQPMLMMPPQDPNGAHTPSMMMMPVMHPDMAAVQAAAGMHGYTTGGSRLQYGAQAGKTKQTRSRGHGNNRKCWLCVVYGKTEEERKRMQMKWDSSIDKLVWADGHGDNYCPSLGGRAEPEQAAAAKRAWSQARSKRSRYRKYIMNT